MKRGGNQPRRRRRRRGGTPGAVHRTCPHCRGPIYFDDRPGPLCPRCEESPEVVWEFMAGDHLLLKRVPLHILAARPPVAQDLRKLWLQTIRLLRMSEPVADEDTGPT